jgi:hypothetical protein
VCAAAPAFSVPVCLFTFPGGIPLPTSSVLRTPHPLCCVSLMLLLLIIQFLFFPWVGVGLSWGLCWSGPTLSVEYHVLLSLPCGPHLPKPSGHCCLVAVQEPSWFLRLTWSGDAMHGLGVWRSQSFASSQWFFL